jgi:hypothetical protein
LAPKSGPYFLAGTEERQDLELARTKKRPVQMFGYQRGVASQGQKVRPKTHPCMNPPRKDGAPFAYFRFEKMQRSRLRIECKLRNIRRTFCWPPARLCWSLSHEESRCGGTSRLSPSLSPEFVPEFPRVSVPEFRPRVSPSFQYNTHAPERPRAERAPRRISTAFCNFEGWAEFPTRPETAGCRFSFSASTCVKIVGKDVV